MGLFIKKPLADLMTEANDSGSKSLKRILGPWSLIALGVGVIIGAGLFSITSAVAAGYTGPAITLSFAIAALGCCFAGLCYAEFASMIPVAGSAYTYSYATMGELVAWIIGWDLVLEYCVAATTVSISWSRYLVVFLEGFGVHLPASLDGLPLGWRYREYPGFRDRGVNEYFVDTRDGRQFYFQWDYRILESLRSLGVRSLGMEIYPYGELYALYTR